MFERRLKLVLFLLFVMTAVLVLRAAQLQIVNRHHWSEAAAEALKREQPIETTRGTIYDIHKVPIAQDVACIDACVDYRAIADPPDEAWVSRLALQWARERRGDEYKPADSARRKQIVEEEKIHVRNRIDALWATLAQVGNKEREAIEQTRQEIIRRVEMRRRYVWYRKYELAREAHEQKKSSDDSSATSWWKQWLIDETQEAPQLDQFEVKVAEQTQAHPILRAISPDVQNQLGKASDDLPGLVLRPGMTRTYPYGEVACHTVGHLSRVRREDLQADPWADDDLRKYQYNDLIGRSGVEALCEPLLRGSRGRIERYVGGSNEEDEKVLDTKQPVAGQNVYTTIDIALQQEILAFFQHAEVIWNERPPEPAVRRRISMHGGAVVIDVKTGQVRALVSNPTFDPNTLDDNYGTLSTDRLNRVLISRATQYPLETGSTIKPVVGIGAITQGLVGVNEGIECTGFLVIGGRRYGVGRCWVASKFMNELGINGVAHHPIPQDDPHRGHDGNPDGFLTFSDALQRSCNVYFETVANRLGMDGLSHWMDQFGLGRPTGIGIEEARGRLPNSFHGDDKRFATWISGIGQGPVAATPLQMCNVAATIARDGTWMRPTLLNIDDSNALRHVKLPPTPATTQSAGTTFTSWRDVPDRVDLNLSPAALAAAHDGMYRVVNTRGGTGTPLHSDVVTVAGKTGTAQAAKFNLKVDDGHGGWLRDEKGEYVREEVPPTTMDWVNPKAPWYVVFGEDGKNFKHSWIIGYAPAKNPQVAFAVMVEYGGSGGTTAAAIAKATLDACIQHGYLSPDHPAGGMTARVKSE